MRRRFQFSLRALLVLMLAVACFFAGIRFEEDRRTRQAKAAALAAKSTISARKSKIARPMTLDEEIRRQEKVVQDFLDKSEAERLNSAPRQRSKTMPTLKGWHSD